MWQNRGRIRASPQVRVKDALDHAPASPQRAGRRSLRVTVEVARPNARRRLAWRDHDVRAVVAWRNGVGRPEDDRNDDGEDVQRGALHLVRSPGPRAIT